MKKIFLFFLFLVIIFIVLGGGYFLLSSSKQSPNPFQGKIKIRYSPPQAKLRVNDKDYSSTNGILTASLDPGQYHLYLSAPGYSPWEKDIDLVAKEVKEIPPVLLFPLQWSRETLVTGNIIQLYPSADYNQLLYVAKEAKYNWCLYHRQTKEKKCFWTSSILPQKVVVSPSFQKALLQFKNNNWKIIYLPPTLVTTPLSLNTSLKEDLAQSENNQEKVSLVIKQVVFLPDNEDEVIVRTENNIFLLNVIEDTIKQISKGETSPFLVSNKKIYFLTANGLFTALSLSSLQAETLSLFSFTSNNLADIKIKKFPHKDIFLIIDNSHRLFLLKPKQDIPSVIADNVQDANISPSENNILLESNNKIIICSYPQLIKTENEIYSDVLPQWFLNDDYILLNSEAILNIYNLHSKKIWPLANNVQSHTYYYDPSVNYLFYLSPSGIIKISI